MFARRWLGRIEAAEMLQRQKQTVLCVSSGVGKNNGRLCTHMAEMDSLTAPPHEGQGDPSPQPHRVKRKSME